jgi:osmoprotectant transport system ATP-binding protein
VVGASQIEFDRVSKLWPGAERPSVDQLSFTVEPGEICAFVGPSGSGKTTALRMVNRLVEPTSGEVRIDGRSTTTLPVEQLRRSIGYVIQQVGLFPHRTVFDNVATVPRLLGWDEGTVSTRVHAMLELVGMPAPTYGARFPAQLSGGQRQRVGVARALAGDPPVLLMDEPFGAIDPLVREKIQDEFLAMQRDVRKTIIIVTHDLDEAMRMGDKVAVLREGGILAQIGTPDELLAAPVDEFVESFLGGDRTLRRLALLSVDQLPLLPLEEAARQGWGMYVDDQGRPAAWANRSPITVSVPQDASVRTALSELVGAGVDIAPVTDAHGRPVAVVTSAVIRAALGDMQPAAGIAGHAFNPGSVAAS